MSDHCAICILLIDFFTGSKQNGPQSAQTSYSNEYSQSLSNAFLDRLKTRNMISRNSHLSRIPRFVLVFGTVCLLATFIGVILVAAHKNEENVPANNVETTQPDPAVKGRIAENFGKLPLSFEINKGQMDERVKFMSHGPGYDLFLTATDAVLKVQKPRPAQVDKSKDTAADANVREGTVLRVKMLGASATPDVDGEDELPGKINYFIGNDQSQWRRNIPTYQKVHFKNVYPGIDVVYYGQQRQLEYDFVVNAGANPKLIRFSVEGAEKLRVDKSGNLSLGLKHGDVTLNKPVIYQVDEQGLRREVKGTYVINGNEVRFKLEQFDTSKPLVIDPVLSYSTLLGGSNSDSAAGIAIDSQGNAYVVGTTEFGNFPTTPGAFKTTSNRGGAYVTKLNSTGTSLVYSTYVNGENGSTQGLGIAVDSTGNAHITGNTSASDFPIVNGLKTTSTFFKTADAAANWNNQNSGIAGNVTAIAVAPNAPNIIYAAALGNIYRSTDGGTTWSKTTSTGLTSGFFLSALAVDPNNSSVVYAGVFSSLFKTTDGANTWTPINASPIFFSSVATIVFDPTTPSTMYIGAANGAFKSIDSGATWIVLNNFGVSGTPNVRAFAIDPTAPSTIYAGTTTNGVFKSTNGGSVWTAMNTGMGGPSPTFVNTIVIDPAHPATLYTGHGASGGINKTTNGGTSWTPLTTDIPQGQVNAMVATSTAVYAAVGSSGVIKTTNGGTNWTSVNNGLWNSFVGVLVVHPTNGSILYAATSSSFSSDAFVTKLNAAGSALLFSTLLGGGNDESGNGIALDAGGNIYVAGQTSSLNFPAVNAAQGAPATSSCSDAFVTKLNPTTPSYIFSTYLRGSQCEMATSIAVDSSGNAYVTGTTGSTDFFTKNAFQPALGSQFNSDVFVTKLTSSGAATYSTYLGGTSSETGLAIAADASGNAYVTGFTSSTDFPTQNAIQASTGGGFNDVFVTKFNSQGSALVYSTFLGGSQNDSGRGIAVDSTGNVYITGASESSDFPLVAGALRTRSVIYKSIDGAGSWSNDNYGFTLPSNAAVLSLVIDPTAPSTIYAGSGAGVFKSTNGGRTWSTMNNGLLSHSIVTLVMDPTTPSTLYALVSDFSANKGVYKTIDGGNSWTLHSNGIPGQELFSLVIDPVTPNTLYVGVGFCCVAGTHIYKTTDGGDNWNPLPAAPSAVPTTMAIDPLNHLTIYAGDAANPGTVSKSTDGGTSWQSLGSTVLFARSIVPSPLTPGLVYVGTDQALFRSTDGGTNWSTVPPRTGKIVFDPVSSSTLYLLTNPQDFNPQGLFKSTDNGQTWTAKNNGFNSPAVAALAVDPSRPSTVHVATLASGGVDAFVTKINAAGNALIYSTFMAGGAGPGFFSFSTQGSAIAVDASGNAYVAGLTTSQSYPVTPDSYQPFVRGSTDAFISKLAMSFIIGGHVTSSGAPLGGAEVVLNDGTSLTSVLTESDGSYQFSRLRQGGNYTISANKAHFTMAPTSQSFNNLNSDQVQDFTATASGAAFFTISGKITENGVGLSGVTVTLSGSQSSVKTTDSNGNYSFELLGGGNYTVTPSLLGFSFGPVSQTFNNLSTNQTANLTATRQSFVVTNANDHGAGSLRQAIINANATLGADTITFNIPGGGVKTISVLIPLPDITERVVIDATTQPGYAGTPLVEIDGSLLGFGTGSGLVIDAGNSTVRGLSIGNFRNGNGIMLNASNGNVIQSNYLGVAANGTTARQNSRGIQLLGASNNTIGGTTAAARNVISGNQGAAIEISNSSSANVIQGNFIGTTASGTVGLSNSGGIAIFDTTSTDNLIGGTAAGAGNVIAGSSSSGIGAAGNGTIIQGNLIGTDVTGTNKIPNNPGITATGQNILIGGLTAAARNVISGNFTFGVFIRGAGNKLQGNYIGTDKTGTVALGNNGNGVVAGDTALVGGTVPEARNIISANTSANVALGINGAGTAATVQGNYIGTDVTGTKSLGATFVVGINVGSNNNLIGGLVPAARNVISGNSIGIQIGSSFPVPLGNTVQGNFIGLNAAGTASLPNTQQGVSILDGAVNNTIGGIQPGAANTIAFNGNGGVIVSGNSQGNVVRGNSIFSNAGLGIDLAGNGVSPNDLSDSDTGPNNLQNFPVISGVMSTSNSTTIQGTLNSLPNTTFQIDFYSNAAVDPSGNGEGAQFFGTTSVTTNNSGNATINATLPLALPTGRVITATATDPNGNTSEFSATDATGAAGSVQFTISSIFVIEDLGTLTLTVQRTGGTAGSLSVDYATADGSAIAGQDYTAKSGTLNFASGETSKTIQIPIINDAVTEPDETFTVSLRNASSLEALGAPSTVVVNLEDRSTVPFLVIDSATVVEGNAGTTTDAVFTVSLSAATGRNVSVSFASSNLSAFGGAACSSQGLGIDYAAVSGALSFTPGTTSLTIPVKVCGDNNAEADEVFRVLLSNPTGASLLNNQGFGLIVNDDPLQLALEESGPSPTQAAAVDSIFALRDPFRVVGIPDWFPTGTEKNTRVGLYVRNLQLNPGELPSAVFVILTASNGQFNIPAEDVTPIPNTDLSQVTFRLPNTVATGTVTVVVFAHNLATNSGTIRIVP